MSGHMPDEQQPDAESESLREQVKRLVEDLVEQARWLRAEADRLQQMSENLKQRIAESPQPPEAN
jgi:hypothetical protein